MRREEGQQHIGKRVVGWTAFWGSYVGILREVEPSRPWRGIIEVRELADWATPTDTRRINSGHGRARRPFRAGRLINVSGLNIKPATTPEETWEASVIRVGEEWLARLARPSGRAHYLVETWPAHIQQVLDEVRGGSYCDCMCHAAERPDAYRAARLRAGDQPCCPHGVPETLSGLVDYTLAGREPRSPE